MNAIMLKEVSLNKKIIITNFSFSLLSLSVIIIITILLGMNHNYIYSSALNIGFNNYYYAIVSLAIILIICYLVNFIIAFFINTNANKLLWSIKITSWIFLLGSFTWIFDLWYLSKYIEYKDSDLKSNDEWIRNKIKIFLSTIFVFSLISILLLVFAIVGQIFWDKNGHKMLFLPLAFWSLLSWSICTTALINTIVLMKWKTNKKTWLKSLFLIMLPSLTSLVLFFKE